MRGFIYNYWRCTCSVIFYSFFIS